jgi:hypothetical protein
MSEGKRCTAETLKEKGWTVTYMGLGPYAAPVGVAGHNDRYVVGPHYFNPSQGYMLMDHARRMMCVVRALPTPRLAVQLLAKYGGPSQRAV